MYTFGCRAHVNSTRSILETWFSLENTLFVYFFLFWWFAYSWRYSFTLYHTFTFFAWYLCVVLFLPSCNFTEHHRNDSCTELLHFCETSTWNQSERGSIMLKKNANCIWSFHVRFNLWHTNSGLALGINNIQDEKNSLYNR